MENKNTEESHGFPWKHGSSRLVQVIANGDLKCNL